MACNLFAAARKKLDAVMDVPGLDETGAPDLEVPLGGVEASVGEVWGFIYMLGSDPPASELEEADRDLDRLVYRLGVMQARVDAAQARYDRLKAEQSADGAED